VRRGFRRRPLVVAVLGALVPLAGLAAPAAHAVLEPPPAPFLPEAASTPAPPPTVTAAAWALVDARSGQVLDGRGIDEPRPVASTIKLLTALTVIERVGFDQTVVVADGVSAGGGAATSVDPGETWTIRDLLAALLVRSGNDAAEALAIHVGGSIDGFVELMRHDAAVLGVSPVLVTPSGLDDANRLTARDLATVARAFLANEQLAAIAAQPTVTLPDIGSVPTRNLLLEQYPDATGLKTGFTSASGYSVVGSATRDGRTLVTVVLGADSEQSRFDDAALLLDHGFAAFDEVRVGRASRLREGGRWVEVATDPAWVTVPAGTDVVVGWRLPRRPDQPGEAVVTVPRADPVTLAATANAPARVPTVATWVRDRLHEALRMAAANGP